MEFKDKFIAYVDILGFKQLVISAEKGDGITLSKILELVRKLGHSDDRKRFEQYGPTICPHASCTRRDLDYRATQISDCVVISAEVSSAGAINLVHQVSLAVTELLWLGVLCRGYITRGSIYHTDGQFIGSGYQRAVENEQSVKAFSKSSDDQGTPFVEIDPGVSDYLRMSQDSCVKEMFSRVVKDDGTITAIFPFQLFRAQFIVDANFDAEKEKAKNNKVRTIIRMMKEKISPYMISANPRTVKKTEHYVAALDAQLSVCDKTDAMIDTFNRPLC